VSRILGFLGGVRVLAESLLGGIVDWLRRLLGSVVERTVVTSVSKRGLTAGQEAAFDAATQGFDRVFDELKGSLPPGGVLSYTVSYHRDSSVERHLVSCSACGRTNRLRRGPEGAACGGCGKPLSPAHVGKPPSN
jgi:hypothetical protein